jgi:hypothetical protein
VAENFEQDLPLDAWEGLFNVQRRECDQPNTGAGSEVLRTTLSIKIGSAPRVRAEVRRQQRYNTASFAQNGVRPDLKRQDSGDG